MWLKHTKIGQTCFISSPTFLFSYQALIKLCKYCLRGFNYYDYKNTREFNQIFAKLKKKANSNFLKFFDNLLQKDFGKASACIYNVRHLVCTFNWLDRCVSGHSTGSYHELNVALRESRSFLRLSN